VAGPSYSKRTASAGRQKEALSKKDEAFVGIKSLMENMSSAISKAQPTSAAASGNNRQLNMNENFGAYVASSLNQLTPADQNQARCNIQLEISKYLY
jgi:hypothetical protein